MRLAQLEKQAIDEINLMLSDGYDKEDFDNNELRCIAADMIPVAYYELAECLAENTSLGYFVNGPSEYKDIFEALSDSLISHLISIMEQHLEEIV